VEAMTEEALGNLITSHLPPHPYPLGTSGCPASWLGTLIPTYSGPACMWDQSQSPTVIS
jgi:hypothetical protein